MMTQVLRKQRELSETLKTFELSYMKAHGGSIPDTDIYRSDVDVRNTYQKKRVAESLLRHWGVTAY